MNTGPIKSRLLGLESAIGLLDPGQQTTPTFEYCNEPSSINWLNICINLLIGNLIFSRDVNACNRKQCYTVSSIRL